jgi:hypothetical protein
MSTGDNDDAWMRRTFRTSMLVSEFEEMKSEFLDQRRSDCCRL